MDSTVKVIHSVMTSEPVFVGTFLLHKLHKVHLNSIFSKPKGETISTKPENPLFLKEYLLNSESN